jgi:hypothetical protein
MMKVAPFRLVCLFALAVTAMPALAEETKEAEAGLWVELNALSQESDACRLTFVAENRLGKDIGAIVFETVLFDQDGQVVDLTLFDFQAVPDASARVRQFDLPGLSCDTLGRVLLNDVNACTGEGLDARACADALRWTSRTDVELLG